MLIIVQVLYFAPSMNAGPKQPGDPTLYSNPISMRKLLLPVSLLLMAFGLKAQISVITPYPAPAQSLTRGLNPSTLTVQVSFTSACTNSKVTIAFPASVTYVPGTVTQTGGTLSGGSGGIIESNISNTSAPVFDILNVTGSGNITFTLSRQAGCGALSSGKDTVKVTGSCGSAVENGANINTYNLLSPSLSLTPAAAVTGAFLGDTYTRNTVITSGGNACTDTVRFYIVYPLQGIKMQDAPLNTITAQVNAGGGTATFTPWKSNGDTLFYKLFGAPLGGDNLLCNGESIKVIENIRVFKCAVTTTFAAGWAKTETVLPYCQTAAATSAMTMAAGVVNLGSATNTPIQTMNWCRPGIYDITVTNNGSGGKAGAAYNVLQTIGYSSSSNTVGLPGDVGTNIQGRLDSVSVNGVKVILTGTTTLSLLNTNQFTTDPDGAGIGLDDLDGDGQYDDLLPGKTYKFRIFEHWQTGTGCPIPSYNFSLRTTATFSTMCSPATTTTAQLITSYYYQTATASPSAITAPAVVQGGQPFSLQSCEGMSPTSSLPAYRPTDSVYLDVIIPVGVALAPTPNITVNGTAITNASYSVISGTPNPDTVRIRRARAGLLVFCYNIDLVYTCGAGGNLTFGMNHYYVGDASCGFIEKLSCKTTTIPAGCPGCPGGGMENLLSTATRTSLGFTDETLSTRVAAAAVTGPPRYTMLPLDTFNLASSAKANGSYNNLRYTLTFGRVASQNLVSFISGTLNIKNAVSSTVTSCTVTPVVTTTTTVQTLSYDLTTCLPGSVINTGDSVWLDQVFAMTTANNDLLLGGALTQIPNTLSRFYNVNGGGTSVYCGGTQFTIYTLGLSKNRSAGAITTNACTAAPENIRVRNGYTSTAIDYFPNEYRPYDRFDSIKLQLPAGYIFNPVYVPTATYQKWSTPTTLATVYMTGGVAGYSGSTMVYKNPYNGNWFPSDLGSTSSNQYGFNTEILANCAAQAVSAIPVSLYLTKYMYTGNPALYTPFVDATSQVLNYNLTSKPIISVQNNTGTVQGTTLQHYWDVQVNSTGVNTAPNVWMAIEKGSGGIVIDSVVLKPGNTVLTPLTYNTSDAWYKVSAAGLASGSSQQARVYFKYANCNPDSVLLKAGWDCTGYPTNPATYACTAAATYLQVDPQVSQVQLSIARNTGNGSSITLCATDSVLAVINSSQSGFLVNPYLEVYPPAGITVQTPVKIEYPIGSGNYQNAAVTPITGGYKVGLSAHTGIGVNGIPGTSQNPGVTGRQAKVKIDITTDCGFTSGNALNLAAFGTRPCQAPASGSGTLSQTGPVTITGATSSGTAGISLNIPVSVLDCGQSTTVNLTATPMVLDTQTGDSVLYTLPAGLQYNGSFGGDANCASCTVNTGTRCGRYHPGKSEVANRCRFRYGVKLSLRCAGKRDWLRHCYHQRGSQKRYCRC